MNSGNAASLLILLLPLLLLAVLVLSQRRRARTMQEFQASVSVGDEVVTTSGLFGRVVGADDTVVTHEVAPGVVVRFDRRAIGMRAGQQSGGAA
jgi:preprotein translocase subunit YajC